MKLACLSAVCTLLVTSASFVLVGCGSVGDSEGVSLVEQQVVGGFESTANQDATVVVRKGNQGPWCTGIVVAPTLVLTARSCLFDPRDATEEVSYIRCLSDGTGAPVLRALDPTIYKILVSSGATGERKLEANGIRFYAGEQLDLCANDLALIEVDNALSAPPMALRLDSKPVPGETGKLVGWGYSEGQSTVLGKDRLQRELRVLAVGPTTFQIPGGGPLQVAEGSFVTGEGPCSCDQGAPFISDDGDAVVGLLSSIEPIDPEAPIDDGIQYCLGAHAVFRSLVRQSGWIRDAFVRTHQVPWLEGNPPLAELGQSCNSGQDCASSVCKETSGGAQFCSRECGALDCPGTLQCLGTPGEQWCVPEQVPSSDTGSSGCAVAFGSE